LGEKPRNGTVLCPAARPGASHVLATDHVIWICPAVVIRSAPAVPRGLPLPGPRFEILLGQGELHAEIQHGGLMLSLQFPPLLRGLHARGHGNNIAGDACGRVTPQAAGFGIVRRPVEPPYARLLIGLRPRKNDLTGCKHRMARCARTAGNNSVTGLTWKFF
jgi:hypothetical protein